MHVCKAAARSFVRAQLGRAWQEAEGDGAELVAARSRLAAYSARPGEEEPPGEPPVLALCFVY